MYRRSRSPAVVVPALATGLSPAPQEIRLASEDTPHTIASVPSIACGAAAASLRGALRDTPAITLTAGEGGSAPGEHFLIRGFRASNADDRLAGFFSF